MVLSTDVFEVHFDSSGKVNGLCQTPFAKRGNLKCDKEHVEVVYRECNKVTPTMRKMLLRYFNSHESCLMDVDRQIVKEAEKNNTVEVDLYVY